MSFIDQLIYAPPSPEPTPSDGLSPTTTPSPTTTMTQLPTTGPSGGPEAIWGTLGVGLVVLLLGIALLAVLRRQRSRTT